MRTIKNHIKEFQKENGNVVFSTKELIQALHIKVDKGFNNINEKLDTKIGNKLFWIIVSASFGFSIFLLKLIIDLMEKIE